MSPVSLKNILLVSLLSTYFAGVAPKPSAFPGQYAEHAMRKRGGLRVVKTTFSKGKEIDWIPLESQGKIAQPPPLPAQLRPDPTTNTSLPLSELELPGAECGPPGTVPVPRVHLNYLAKATKLKGSPKTRPSKGESKRQFAGTHWYVSSQQAVSNLGGSASFSMFKPYVQYSADFSLLQTTVARNAGAANMQTVEAGWIHYPDQVSEPHLFTFFTTNNNAAWGDYLTGWNQDVAGWVQYDTTFFPGTVFTQTSSIGGSQYQLIINYQLFGGNWWLFVRDRWIGYYPASLFSANIPEPGTTLAVGSDRIYFYGEVLQTNDHLTTTDMGSGNFAGTGFGNAAYIRNMVYYDASGNAQKYTASFTNSDDSKWNYDHHPASGGTWASYVYLGGPGAGGVVGG